MADNFNYISFGNWDKVQGEVDDVTLLRGRMFEYTPVDIAKRLEGLDARSVAFLETLPTFLCSEVGATGGGDVSMLIKYGRVTGITPNRTQILFNFETMIDFEEVSFDDIETAREVFDLEKFQLYRTHWAVRENAASDVLVRLAAAKPELAHLIAEYAQQIEDSGAIQPPPRDKKIIGTANSVEAFLQLLYNNPSNGSYETFFRGHEDASYELTPSLLRKWNNGDWKFMPSEDRLCKELLIAHYEDFQSDQYCFDRLVRMQHYGLPTRLLDISSNPLVALYFACSKNPEIDGEVIVFQVASERIKYYDSDTVSCLSNLSNLTYEQKDEIDLSLDQIAFNETDIVEKLLHHIKSEKGYFEGRIVPDDLGSIVCVKAKRTNSRIKSQAGAFLLFGHEVALPDAGLDDFVVTRITVREKERILKQLDKININATTVYPSIDQTAVHLRDHYQSMDPERTNEDPAPDRADQAV
ncbi:MAG: FRG domain-containing protein [Paracoccaceae bacterium]